jgi:hypothetical protein
MLHIQEINTEKYGFNTALHIDAAIRAAINTLDQPMNLSKPGRLGTGERERLVDIETKKNEYLVIFQVQSKGNIEILNVKHHLELYP